MINVHALKYVSDQLSREPRNVGLIVSHEWDGRVELKARFVGQRANGSVQGRALHMPTDVYQRWVSYFVRKVQAAQWDDLRALARTRPTSFYLDHISVLTDDQPLEMVLDRLYPDVVTVKSETSEGPRDDLKDQVERVLQSAGVFPERTPTVTGKIGDDFVPVQFEYGYTNGQLHLMDRVQVHGPQVAVRKNAFDFAMRAQMAREAEAAQSFVAFVNLQDSAPAIENDLKVLDRWAHVIDVGDLPEALRTVTALMAH